MKIFIIFLIFISSITHATGARLKDIARIDGNRDVDLVGYGIVVGLAGSGDSAKNRATLQSLANALLRFGLQVDESDLAARNVAAVMVTGVLPAYSEPGDKIDLRVASTGDARSLSGGTLLLAPLYGADENLYALGQGALTVGGYHFESFSNTTRKNITTVGQIAGGGSVEKAPPRFLNVNSEISIILNEPDFTTANRIVNRVKNSFNPDFISAVHPGKIKLSVPANANPMSFIASLENVSITPDTDARVVVNERTGTIVAGANVRIGEVSIAHGNLRVEIQTKFEVSQPQFLVRPSDGVETTVIPDTSIAVVETSVAPLQMAAGSTVGDLAQALYKLKISTRDTISILQSIKAAGALYADLVIQ